MNFCKGKKHDFRLFKESEIHTSTHTKIYTDTGYVGITKIHSNSVHPKKRSKNCPLTKKDKKNNHIISKQRIGVEHIIGFVKRFRILLERYRNRRKRFALRFSLIAGICNFDISA